MELTDMFVLAVGVLSLATNGILLIILSKDPLKCFRTSTTYFIISLGVSDLLTGANACLWAMDNLVPFLPDFQRYLLSLFWITTQASFLTLMAMSLERFLIVKYPFYCRMWITKKRVSLSIAIIWLISATLGGLVLLPPPKRHYVQFSIYMEFFVSVFIIAGMYAFILFGIKKSQKALKGVGQRHQGSISAQIIRDFKLRRPSFHRKAIYRANDTVGVESNERRNRNRRKLYQKQSLPPSIVMSSHVEDRSGRTSLRESSKQRDRIPEENNSGYAEKDNERIKASGSSLNSSGAGNDVFEAAQSIMRREKLRKIEHEMKLTAVVLLLVGVLALTVLPYLLASQIHVGYLLFSPRLPSPGLIKFIAIYFPIELLNFAVNPLIYAWRLPQYRRTLKYLFTRHKPDGHLISADFVRTCSQRL